MVSSIAPWSPSMPQALAIRQAVTHLKQVEDFGNAFVFVKVQAGSHDRSSCDYGISDTWVTRSRNRQLATVLQVLKRIKLMIEPRISFPLNAAS
jgi:hypothetical protein